MRGKPSVIALVVSAAVGAQAPAGAPAPPSYSLREFGTNPRPAYKRVLLGVPAVQEELKLTDAQKQAIEDARSRHFEKLQKARGEFADQSKFVEARNAIFKDMQAAILAPLDPKQRDRLDQIQLQSQGPLAFTRAALRQRNFDESADMAQHLKLTDDQARQVEQLAADGEKEILKAADVPIVLDPKAGAPSMESIRKLVETPGFQAAKQKAREAARKTWSAVIARIEQVLTEPQRTAYHALLGAPFDMSRIRFGDEVTEDVNNVATALNVGGGGGQPAAASRPASYRLLELGTMSGPIFPVALAGTPAVGDELKLTEAQKTAINDLRERHFEKVQKARREMADRQKFLAARDTLFKETDAALRESLELKQRVRLDQILLQALGPRAFDRSAERAPWQQGDGTNLVQRLKLTDDQARRAEEIATDSRSELDKAATVPIVLDPNAGAPTPESIKKLVESPEFKAAKQKARDAAHKAWAATIERIEQVLTEPQRTAYHELVGAPFDLSKIRFGTGDSDQDATLVARALNAGGGGGGGGGQRADPDFNTRVDRPAYVVEHPRVLFDEAHNNFHTTDGRYKPFAELITHDGYRVIPNKEMLTPELLAKADILISANALAAGRDESGSAFTEAECDAVRDWVKAGGSLLLITDHAPFGVGSESLARRFGVEMSKAFTSDPENSEGGPTSLVFTRKNNLLGDHAITRGRDESERLNRIQTFTGQSLKGPEGSTAILKLADTAFDDGPDGKPVSAAGRVQGLALTFGKGRVVVMGEAAELSAQLIGTERFGMNTPGLDNRQLALNIMHWLSGMLEPRQGVRKKAG